MPHKSLQEYHAAQYIVHQLQGGFSGGSIWQLLQETSQDPIMLKKLLEGYSGTDDLEDAEDISEDLTEQPSLKNLLLHVVGLLSHPDVSSLPGAIQVSS